MMVIQFNLYLNTQIGKSKICHGQGGLWSVCLYQLGQSEVGQAEGRNSETASRLENLFLNLKGILFLSWVSYGSLYWIRLDWNELDWIELYRQNWNVSSGLSWIWICYR